MSSSVRRETTADPPHGLLHRSEKTRKSLTWNLASIFFYCSGSCGFVLPAGHVAVRPGLPLLPRVLSAKPQGPAEGLNECHGAGGRGTPGVAPGPGWEVGAGVRGAARGRAEGTLTGLVAHAAQDRPRLHPKVSLSLLQALVHQSHHIIGGDVPSVWGEE